MASTVLSNLVTYDTEVYLKTMEKITQFITVFNEGSANTVRTWAEDIQGNYKRSAFWLLPSNAFTRRDLTSVASATGIALSQEEFIEVRSSRKWGPFPVAAGALSIIGQTSSEVADELSDQFSDFTVQNMLNDTLNAGRAALANVSTLLYDATTQSTTTITPQHVNSTLGLLGDAAGRIKCIIMHSKVFRDYVAESITSNRTQLYSGLSTNLFVVEPSATTYGLPIVVTDSTALKDSGASATTSDDRYYTLLLQEDGLIARMPNNAMRFLTTQETGLEQIVYQSQGEVDYMTGIKGFQWDVTNGGSNPTATSLATGSNWDQVVTSIKDCAGAVLKTT